MQLRRETTTTGTSRRDSPSARDRLGVGSRNAERAVATLLGLLRHVFG
ncbi:hypothetical protein ACFPRL_17825 [Pseudoclavibacter helvolus]